MIYGQTPFFDKNRKIMFHRIVSMDVNIPTTFSDEAGECIRGLLTRNVQKRLGSSDTGGEDIMATKYFNTIDFTKLYNKQLVPPFKPDVTDEQDTKYVPKFFLDNKAVDSIDGYSNNVNTKNQKTKKNTKDNNPQFDAFTFQGDSNF